MERRRNSGRSLILNSILGSYNNWSLRRKTTKIGQRDRDLVIEKPDTLFHVNNIVDFHSIIECKSRSDSSCITGWAEEETLICFKLLPPPLFPVIDKLHLLLLFLFLCYRKNFYFLSILSSSFFYSSLPLPGPTHKISCSHPSFSIRGARKKDV